MHPSLRAYNRVLHRVQLATQRPQPAISLTDDELCTLTWCWRAADRMMEAARSIAVNTLAVSQIFYLLSSRFARVSALRRELFTSNPVSWLCVGVMLLLQLGFIYLPFMQATFDTTSVGLKDWIIPLISSLIIFAVVELEKLIRRMTGKY